MSDATWTPLLEERLRKLWDQRPQISARKIGEILGVSKSAVTGKVHRMKLPSRPSPIREKQNGGPRPTRRSRVNMVANLATDTEISQGEVSSCGEKRVDNPQTPQSTRSQRPHRRHRAPDHCQWPGNGDKASFLCKEPCSHGRPYCEEHAEIAYEKKPARKEGTPVRETYTSRLGFLAGNPRN